MAIEFHMPVVDLIDRNSRNAGAVYEVVSVYERLPDQVDAD